MDPTALVTRDTPTLLTLPQEVLDMIFGFAYPRQPQLSIVSKRNWGSDDDSDSDDEYFGLPRRRPPYPGPLVNTFMISKLYLVNSARVFIANQVIMARDTFGSSGIGAAYAKEVHAGSFTFSSLGHYHNLQRLTISCTPADFDEYKPWKQHLDEPTLRKIYWLSDLLRVRGVQQLTMHFDPQHYVKKDVRREIWDGNVRRLEALIRSHVLQPKQPKVEIKRVTSEPTWTPLYHRSQVSLFSSKLRKGTYIPPLRERQANKPTREGSASTKRAYTRMMALKGKILTDDDMPQSVSDLEALVSIDGEAVMKWIEDAKANRKAVRDFVQ